MKPSRSTPAQPPAPTTAGLAGSWVRFWFTPADPLGLHVVRLLTGLVLLLWLLPLAGHVDGLFGLQGWFDHQAYADAAALDEAAQAGRSMDAPPKPATWSVLYLARSQPQLLPVLYWLSVAVLVLFTLGVAPRLTAVLTWLVVASFTAGPAVETDADVWLLILTFYLMIGYVLLGQRDAGAGWFARLLGPRDAWLFGRPRPSLGANLALRLLQVHVAVVVVTGGLHKLQFGDWWAGVALWYPLHPPLETTVAQARAHAAHAERYMAVLSLAAYAVLAWQIAFPVFAWRPRWRPLLLGGAAVGLGGAAFVYDLPLLGPALFIGCASFVTPEEWQRWLTRLDRLRTRTRPAGATGGADLPQAVRASSAISGRS